MGSERDIVLSREKSACLSLQVFHSDTCEFSNAHNILAKVPIDVHGHLRHEFRIPQSGRWLRLDVGEYFSRHSGTSIVVSDGTVRQVIDHRRDIKFRHQFEYTDDMLICGFDAYAVFRNPFPGQEIVVAFESTVNLRIEG